MYKKLSDQYEDLNFELQLFKEGNERLFKRLELETLVKLEEDFQNSLKNISKIKNEVYISLILKLFKLL